MALGRGLPMVAAVESKELTRGKPRAEAEVWMWRRESKRVGESGQEGGESPDSVSILTAGKRGGLREEG